MKNPFYRALCVCSAAALCLALVSGCSSRTDNADTPPTNETSSSSVPGIEEDETPSSASEPEATPTAAPEPTPGQVEIVDANDANHQAILADVRMFVDCFGPQEFSAATQLKSEEVLTLCLTSLYLQKDLNAYIFEKDGSDELIPSALLTEAAVQRFGIDGFIYPASERFDQEKDCYRYDPRTTLPYTGGYELGEIQGNEDGTLSCTATFPDQPDTPSLVYTFRLMSQNGAPYLQIISAHVPHAV